MPRVAEPAAGREWIGPAALLLSLAAVAVTVFAAAAGNPISIDIGRVHVSIRHARNPALAAVFFGVLAVWRLGPARAGGYAEQLERRLAQRSSVLAVLLAIGVTIAAWSNGALVAGSADSSGYLSQAREWARHGAVRIRAQPVSDWRFANGVRVIAPVGWTPASGGADLAPTYPPGLPLLMALFQRVAGDGAEFWVVPATGGLLVWTMFVFGRLLGGPIVGLLAALGVAVSPTVLFQSLQPMSDVPAATAWTGAVALLSRPGVGRTIAASAAAVVACLIRPNLFAMVPMLAIAAFWWEPAVRHGLRRALGVAVTAGVAALGSASWQQALYGASTTTGYGDVGTLFAWRHVWPNLASFPSWLYETHGVFLLPAVVAPLVVARGMVSARVERTHAVAVAWWCLAMFGVLLGFYLLYLPFENWPYTRFLLPVLPLVIALSAISLVAALNHLPHGLHLVGLVAAVVLIPSAGISRARDLAVFGIQQTEQRYVAAAEFTAAQPPEAVFLSMAHSGSISYYSGRPILRWDWIEPSEIDDAIDDLIAAGHTIYAVLDDWEVADVEARHSGTMLASRLRTPVFEFRPSPAIGTLIFAVSNVNGR